MNHSDLVRLTCALFLASSWLEAQGPGSSWTLNGRVSGEKNEAISGVNVLVGYIPPAPAGGNASISNPLLGGLPFPGGKEKPAPQPAVITEMAGVAITDGSGNFSVKGSKGGTVVVCVQAAKSGFLDPCHWDEKRVTVAVSPGRTIDAGKVVVRKGALLRVRLEDAQGRLTDKAGKPVVRTMWTYSTPLGMSYPMRLDSASGSAISHSALVEAKKAVKVSLSQSGLIVQEKPGKPNVTNVALDVLMRGEGEEQVVSVKVVAVESKP